MEDLTYMSDFLPDVAVSVIFKDSDKYNTLKPIFDEYGFGFMVPNQNLIIIDGENLTDEEYNDDILNFIEAHEVSHILLGHDGPRNEQDELDADYGAYLLLKKHGIENSVEMLLDTFFERHNTEFDIKRVKELEDKIL